MSEDLLIYGVLGFVPSDSSCKFINQNNIFKITFLKLCSCNNAPITCKMMLEIIPTTFIPRRIQTSLFFLIENNFSAQQKISLMLIWCQFGAAGVGGGLEHRGQVEGGVSASTKKVQKDSSWLRRERRFQLVLFGSRVERGSVRDSRGSVRDSRQVRVRRLLMTFNAHTSCLQKKKKNFHPKTIYSPKSVSIIFNPDIIAAVVPLGRFEPRAHRERLTTTGALSSALPLLHTHVCKRAHTDLLFTSA